MPHVFAQVAIFLCSFLDLYAVMQIAAGIEMPIYLHMDERRDGLSQCKPSYAYNACAIHDFMQMYTCIPSQICMICKAVGRALIHT